jgi:AcrR family transcriptional regulator
LTPAGDGKADAEMNEKKDDRMWIGELAEASGVNISTIKYYLGEGLLPGPEKLRRNVGLYDGRHLDRLGLIKVMRGEGLSIKTIRSVFENYYVERISDWEEVKGGTGKCDAAGTGEERPPDILSDRERHALEITEAARRLFASIGYRGTSMEDVANGAGMGKSTLYRYFESKEELFLEIVDMTVDELLEVVEESAAHTNSTISRLGLKGLAFIQRYRDIQILLNSLITEASRGNQAMAGKAREVLERTANYLAKDLRSGMEEGVFRSMDYEAVSYALIGIAELAATREIVDRDLDALKFLASLQDFIQRGLLGR